VVVSNMFYLHPYLGKIPHFDKYFSKGLIETTNQYMVMWLWVGFLVVDLLIVSKMILKVQWDVSSLRRLVE